MSAGISIKVAAESPHLLGCLREKCGKVLTMLCQIKISVVILLLKDDSHSGQYMSHIGIS